MLYCNKPPLMSTLYLFLTLFVSSHISRAQNLDLTLMNGRTLMGFKETPDGGNATFDCSPSGPCIPCTRAEKSDEKYRCGETVYRIRLKCVPSVPETKDAKNSKIPKKRSTLELKDFGVNQHDMDPTIFSRRQRRLLGDSSKSQGGSRAYVTYRSCIPAISDEKLSVLGFEALMLTLLISSGSFMYFRRKRSSAAAGGAPARLPTSSRF